MTARPRTSSGVATLVEPSVAVRVAVVVVATTAVATVNVALVAPAATVTEELWTSAAAESLARATVVPPDGAGPLSVTVPTLASPPWMLAGLTESADSVGAATESVADLEIPPPVAVITAVVEVAVAEVETLTDALDAPAGIVRRDEALAGADAEIRIEAPVGPAGPFRVIRATVADPPITDDGVRRTPVTDGAATVRVADLVFESSVAETVTSVLADTGRLVATNVAVDAPAGTETLAGTVAAAVLELERVAVRPPAGAAPVSVTVTVLVCDPTTSDGLRLTEETAVRATVSVLVRGAPTLAAAEIVTDVVAITGTVEIVNVALLAPPGTVICAESVAEAVSLLVTEIVAPPVGAAPVRYTVPSELAPPVTVDGLRVTAVTVGGAIVKVPDTPLPWNDAVTVTAVDAATGDVPTENVAVVAPAATVTLVGTVALAAFPERVTTVPPAGAAVRRVTVPVVEVPPTTRVGESVTVEIGEALTVSVPVADVDPLLAVIVAVVAEATVDVVTENAALVWPCRTVTLAAGVASTVSLESVTTNPAVGAGCEIVTVPVDDVPP